MQEVIVVKAAFDAEAAVWFVESSDLAGLNVEASSIEELRAKLPAAVVDLLEAERGADAAFDIPIEIIAHASARARGGAMAACEATASWFGIGLSMAVAPSSGTAAVITMSGRVPSPKSRSPCRWSSTRGTPPTRF